MKRRFTCAAIWGVFLGFFSFQYCGACTLWGATGHSVEGGGTLIAKNRDGVPDHRQELILLKPEGGYKFLGLHAVGGTEPGIKAGVNEKGLVLLSATAGPIPEAERNRLQQKKGLMSYLLAHCASAGEVIHYLELMQRPMFYMVGDRTGLAVIEIAPGGQRAVTLRNSGALAHTNHYCVMSAQGLRKPGISSTQRYTRIEELLKNHNKALVIEDFVRFSGDRKAGPDNSIWRTGSNPEKTRTLATWVVTIPARGSPHLYFKTAHPGKPEWVYRVSVEETLRGDDRNKL